MYIFVYDFTRMFEKAPKSANIGRREELHEVLAITVRDDWKAGASREAAICAFANSAKFVKLRTSRRVGRETCRYASMSKCDMSIFCCANVCA